jgi:hypothetical protein
VRLVQGVRSGRAPHQSASHDSKGRCLSNLIHGYFESALALSLEKRCQEWCHADGNIGCVTATVH